MEISIWHIGDTHGQHKLLSTPSGVDLVIHSGDFSNYYNLEKNLPEAEDFLLWYSSIPIKYKVLIAGNHDSFPAKDNFRFREQCEEYGIIYLEHESVEIEGLRIFGSPYTPSFGNWHFMRDRAKLYELWDEIPEDTDILVVHGPPKGVLDLSWSREGRLEMCGCKSLRTHILMRLNLMLCCFGHIHNNNDILNAGTMNIADCDTTFSNGSVLTDGKFGVISSTGNIFHLTYGKKDHS